MNIQTDGLDMDKAQTSVNVVFDTSVLDEMLAQASVVSFDFFDTLFVRSIMDPEDAFDILGKQFGISNFRDLRRAAQTEAFRQMALDGRKEITLAEIYASFNTDIGVSTKTMMQAEYDLELELVHPNEELKELFDKTISSGKKVILTSDMYLPADFFDYALRKYRFQNIPLYISADRNATKRDFGELFDVIAADLGVAHEYILHIGDNFESDVNKARAKGLMAYHYVAQRQPPKLAHQSPESSVARGLLRKQHQHIVTGSATELGFMYGGPAVVAFLDWIGQQSQLDKIDRILFLARDGFCLDRIAKKRTDHQFPKFDYFLGSRTVFTLAAITPDNFADFIPFLISGADGLSCSELLDRIGVLAPAEHVMESLGLGVEVAFENKNSIVFEEFLYAYRWEILKVCKRNRRALFLYLQQLGITSGMRVALVDVGWSGTTQDALEIAIENMLDLDVFGYYFCLSNLPACLERSKKRRMKGLFSMASVSSEFIQEIYANRVGIELFFSAPHRSIIGLDIRADGQICALEDMRGDDSFRSAMYTEFVQGMDIFFNSFEEIRNAVNLEVSAQDLAMPLVEFSMSDSWRSHPTLIQVKNFDAWSFTHNRHVSINQYE